MKFIDLFCGIGGFHQALKDHECVFACDIDEKCRYIYEKNYHIKPQGDITKINIETIPDMDIICAGFPCQSFSNSGKKKGLTDQRGQLFEYILKIAALKQPSFLFLENVKHIKKIDGGTVFQHIINRIDETGYRIEIIELSPHELGIPQHRERVIFVCVRKDIEEKNIDFTLPNIVPVNIFEPYNSKYRISEEEEEILTVWDKMIEHMDTDENLSPTILCNEFQKKYSEKEFKKLPAWKQDYLSLIHI